MITIKEMKLKQKFAFTVDVLYIFVYFSAFFASLNGSLTYENPQSTYKLKRKIGTFCDNLIQWYRSIYAK